MRPCARSGRCASHFSTSHQDMVKICDDAKYEEVARQRLTEEQAKKQDEDDAVRRERQEKQASEAARKDAARQQAEEQARREQEEKKWMEKQEKQRKEVEEKKKLQVLLTYSSFLLLYFRITRLLCSTRLRCSTGINGFHRCRLKRAFFSVLHACYATAAGTLLSLRIPYHGCTSPRRGRGQRSPASPVKRPISVKETFITPKETCELKVPAKEPYITGKEMH
jgi:cation transport ATPase